MEIQGTSALVTGAGRGIGRALALELARAGVRVLAVARTATQLGSLISEVESFGGQAVAYPGDIRKTEVCDGAVAAAVAKHGGLQILVNNAGLGAHATVAEMTDATWDQVIGTNLTGVFRMTRAALPYLTAHGGHIFMLSSLAGRNAIAGMSAYCASKAALDHLTACLMLEVRHQGVKVTTIAPGSVDTAFGDAAGMPRSDSSWMLQAQDVAGTILDLLRMRHEALSSRIEMRPLQPPKH